MILPTGGTVGVLIGTETRNGIMSNRLLEDNIELGKALLDICYMWIGGSWLNRDFFCGLLGEV